MLIFAALRNSSGLWAAAAPVIPADAALLLVVVLLQQLQACRTAVSLSLLVQCWCCCHLPTLLRTRCSLTASQV